METPKIPESYRSIASAVTNAVYRIFRTYRAPELEITQASFSKQVEEVLALHIGRKRPTGYTSLEAMVSPIMDEAMTYLTEDPRTIENITLQILENQDQGDGKLFFYNPAVAENIGTTLLEALGQESLIGPKNMKRLGPNFKTGVENVIGYLQSCLRSHQERFGHLPTTQELKTWKKNVLSHQQLRARNSSYLSSDIRDRVDKSLEAVIEFDEHQAPQEVNQAAREEVLLKLDQRLRKSFFLRMLSRKARCPAHKEIPKMVSVVMDIFIVMYDREFQVSGLKEDAGELPEILEESLIMMEVDELSQYEEHDNDIFRAAQIEQIRSRRKSNQASDANATSYPPGKSVV